MLTIMLALPLFSVSKEFDKTAFHNNLHDVWSKNKFSSYIVTTDLAWADDFYPPQEYRLAEELLEQDEILQTYTAKAGLQYRFDINNTLTMGATIPIVTVDATGNIPTRFTRLFNFRETSLGMSFTYTF